MIETKIGSDITGNSIKNLYGITCRGLGDQQIYSFFFQQEVSSSFLFQFDACSVCFSQPKYIVTLK